jgi:hypothetical protein
MINMIMDQGLFGIVDRIFDHLKLLGKGEARPAFLHHPDDHMKVPVGAPEALEFLLHRRIARSKRSSC